MVITSPPQDKILLSSKARLELSKIIAPALLIKIWSERSNKQKFTKLQCSNGRSEHCKGILFLRCFLLKSSSHVIAPICQSCYNHFQVGDLIKVRAGSVAYPLLDTGQGGSEEESWLQRDGFKRIDSSTMGLIRQTHVFIQHPSIKTFAQTLCFKILISSQTRRITDHHQFSAFDLLYLNDKQRNVCDVK